MASDDKVTVGEAHKPSQGTIDKAMALKDEGNRMLAEHHFEKAAELYSEAIKLHPNPIFYANRAFVAMKQESYGLAAADAEAAIGLDPGYVKAYYRRASANFALGKYKEALKDFRHVLKLHPKDKDAMAKYRECDKQVKAAAFAAAIQTEDTMPVSQTISVESIVVEPSYDGPHLGPNGEVTPEFLDSMLERFREQKLIHKKYVVQLLLASLRQLEALPNLVPIKTSDTPGGVLTVCGDTHGQFFDVLHIFERNGKPSATNPYLFNGDFVDRGSFSFEVVFTFLAYKVAYPSAMHVVRGNHESKNMNRIYGFEGEIKHKYDEQVMGLFSEVFCAMPLCATVDDRVFVVHGGLASEDGVTLDDIQKVNRFREPPDSGLMSDLLWSDPQPLPGRSPSKRGVGLSFGPDVTKRFLELNNLDMVVRSHEVKEEGYHIDHDGKCVTVFSAPNYCDQMGNKGAYIRFSGANELKPEYVQFDASPHPPIRPMAYASGLSVLGL